MAYYRRYSGSGDVDILVDKLPPLNPSTKITKEKRRATNLVPFLSATLVATLIVGAVYIAYYAPNDGYCPNIPQYYTSNEKGDDQVVYLLRHGEKVDDDNPNLSCSGWYSTATLHDTVSSSTSSTFVWCHLIRDHIHHLSNKLTLLLHLG
jgi:hypothetical protein